MSWNAGGRNIAQEIALDLEELGFVSCYTLLNAADYGVPQTRERMFLIGLRRELESHSAFPDPVLFVRRSHAATSRSVEPPPGPFGTSTAFRNGSRLAGTARGSGRTSPAAVTAKQAIGDLLRPSPVFGMAPSHGGPRKFDKAMWLSSGRHLLAYARDMRSWLGFEAHADGPSDHVIRYLPRDWPIFERMRPGDDYPAAHKIAEMLFQEQLRVRRATGEGLRKRSRAWEDFRRSIVPPYRVDGFPNKWWKVDPDRPSRTLMAHLGKDSYSHIHYDDEQARTISVREACLSSDLSPTHSCSMAP